MASAFVGTVSFVGPLHENVTKAQSYVETGIWAVEIDGVQFYWSHTRFDVGQMVDCSPNDGISRGGAYRGKDRMVITLPNVSELRGPALPR